MFSLSLKNLISGISKIEKKTFSCRVRIAKDEARLFSYNAWRSQEISNRVEELMAEWVVVVLLDMVVGGKTSGRDIYEVREELLPKIKLLFYIRSYKYEPCCASEKFFFPVTAHIHAFKLYVC